MRGLWRKEKKDSTGYTIPRAAQEPERQEGSSQGVLEMTQEQEAGFFQVPSFPLSSENTEKKSFEYVCEAEERQDCFS